MRVIKFTLLLFTVCLSHCTMPYSAYSEPDNERVIRPFDELVREPGKCYAKALISDVYQEDYINYIVYTGVLEQEENEVEIQDVTVILKPATTKWEKRMADRNCLSADPDDCLVWCLVEIPAETMKYTTLIDTSLSKNFEVKQYRNIELVQEGGFTKWQEVLCKDQITPDVVKQIQNQLSNLGYYPGPSDNVVGKMTKAALVEFQRDNNLPVGQIDMKSMDMLGVSFE